MNRSIVRIIMATGLAFSVLGGLALVRPILTAKTRFLPKYRSLAGLEQVRLTIDLPAAIVELGVSPADVRKRCRTLMNEGGIAVVDNGTAPEMRVRVAHLTEPAVADACAFSVRLSVS